MTKGPAPRRRGRPYCTPEQFERLKRIKQGEQTEPAVEHREGPTTSIEYRTVPTAFASGDVLVPAVDALDYGRDLLAGVDGALVELAEGLLDDLATAVGGTRGSQWQSIERLVWRRVDAARDGVADYFGFAPRHAVESPPGGLESHDGGQKVLGVG